MTAALLRKRSWRRPGRALVIVGLAVGLGACGDSGPSGEQSASGTATAATVPTVAEGKLTACADMQQPPIEFYDAKHVPTGSEVNLSREIAKDLGLEYTVHQVQFNGIVAALLSKQCDFISAGLYVTPEREETLTLLPKTVDGQALLVRKGDGGGITGFDASLAGKRLGMISGYSTIDGVKDVCKQIASDGGKPCSVVLFSDATSNISALKAAKVDAAVDSVASQSWYAKQHAADFEVVKEPKLFLPSDVAFGLRQDATELAAAMKTSIDRLYESGWMCTDLAEWGLESTALPPHEC